MSDLDELAEAARNRGLKLVRSRIRTPGKRRFGKAGLTDQRGKPVFGMDDKGPLAKPEEVQEYLRNLGAQDWGASLDVAVLPRQRKPAKRPLPEAANDPEPAPRRKAAHPPKPKPAPRPPQPKVREAKPGDAPRLTELVRELGHAIDEKSVRKNLKTLKKTGELPLVATLDGQVVGLCGVHRTVSIHRDAPLGRITLLVIAKEIQRHGLGRLLVEAAETQLRKAGCRQVEVTSNDRRPQGHAFYRHMGYERTSIRFVKTL